jgi:hypothetical protein
MVNLTIPINAFIKSIILDWFYCTLLRSGNPLIKSSELKPRIPEQKFLSHEHSIQLLPIDKTSTRDNLLHSIESNRQPKTFIQITYLYLLGNKMIFLSGPPAIGKSIRVFSKNIFLFHLFVFSIIRFANI